MQVIERLEVRRLLAVTGAWSDTIDNPYMPFIPGMIWVYRGVKDGVAEKNRVVVQSETKVITGVTCTIVLDRVYELSNGNWDLTEKTHDWYAQDRFGNVWYFGEETKELENGMILNTEGSWEAGVNGATPGIVMEAEPQVGDSYQQEFAVGVAQDQAEVLSLGARARTNFGNFSNCLKTQESSPLDPGALEVKYYRKGIGFVRSQTIAGDEQEILKLVSFVP